MLRFTYPHAPARHRHRLNAHGGGAVGRRRADARRRHPVGGVLALALRRQRADRRDRAARRPGPARTRRATGAGSTASAWRSMPRSSAPLVVGVDLLTTRPLAASCAARRGGGEPRGPGAARIAARRAADPARSPARRHVPLFRDGLGLLFRGPDGQLRGAALLSPARARPEPARHRPLHDALAPDRGAGGADLGALRRPRPDGLALRGGRLLPRHRTDAGVALAASTATSRRWSASWC